MRLVFLFLLVLSFSACSDKENESLPENYFEDLESWKKDRDTRLRAENSFVNLIGLHWLEKGPNTFGSGSFNNIVFPKSAPAAIGTITLEDSIVSFSSAPGAEVVVDTMVQKNAVVYHAAKRIQPSMQVGRYRWNIIERAGRYGLRLRDLESPKVKKPLNIKYYDWSEDWRVEAEFIPYEQPRTIQIDNIVGFRFDEDIYGELVFNVGGKTHTILPVLIDEGFFILFADETSGDETYGAGRYMLANRPDEQGMVILDFNTAYNPPCAFTEFATCPLPPKENILNVAIRAGEKVWN
jgi:uncharacterized protein (DUF1684 family)